PPRGDDTFAGTNFRSPPILSHQLANLSLLPVAPEPVAEPEHGDRVDRQADAPADARPEEPPASRRRNVDQEQRADHDAVDRRVRIEALDRANVAARTFVGL